MRIISHGPFVSIADVEARIAATPGSLGALYRQVARELGVLPQPPGTVRRDERFAIDGAPPSMNTNEVRSHWKGEHAAKKEWQGRFARALHGLELDRPIRSVGADGKLAPIFAHIVVTVPGGKLADSPNYWIASKSLGDAFTGRPAPDRAVNYDHRRYVAGWLDQDDDRHWLHVLEVRAGPPSVTGRLVWDEPAPMV